MHMARQTDVTTPLHPCSEVYNAAALLDRFVSSTYYLATLDSEDSEDEYQRRRRRRLEDEDADADAAFLILQQGGEARSVIWRAMGPCLSQPQHQTSSNAETSFLQPQASLTQQTQSPDTSIKTKRQNKEDASRESQMRSSMNRASAASNTERTPIVSTKQEQRAAIVMFHEGQQQVRAPGMHHAGLDKKQMAASGVKWCLLQGLYHFKPALEVLSDLRLDKVLGTGGFAIVMRGLWRDSTVVAVKVFCSSPEGMPIAGQQAQPPLRALAEALLSRHLAHPHIVKTFDVRCCQLSPAFIQALPSSTQASTPTSVAHRISMMTTDPMHGDEHAAQHASKVAEVLQQFSTYTGITPLYTKQPTSTAGQASLSSFDNQSADGFGAPVGMNNTACLSWQDLITSVRAMPNDFLTVIVMQHASYGTLWKSIHDGIFTTQDDMTYADRRRRLRALLRTAREIAMGIEHLHACHVVHGDLKPPAPPPTRPSTFSAWLLTLPLLLLLLLPQANVLLQDSRVDSRGFTALLADFGLARLVTGAKHMSVKPSGTASYVSAYGMAPELLASGEVSNRTDVYAYERVLAAVVHGFRPVWEVADEGQMPGLHMLYNRCVDGDPGARPTARELVAQLGQLEEEVRNEAQQERKLLKRQGKQEGR
ncbi:hypothetical protein QJQ45_016146 [Haematococcus lacustris]|nr:hypothetical protein QJQ45_016146 [Haematococcus lacustris]